MQSFHYKKNQATTSEYKPELCGSALDGNIKQSEFCAVKHSMNESSIVISFDKGDVCL